MAENEEKQEVAGRGDIVKVVKGNLLCGGVMTRRVFGRRRRRRHAVINSSFWRDSSDSKVCGCVLGVVSRGIFVCDVAGGGFEHECLCA